MRLLFKQRLFSWFDSYDVYDESGATVYRVEGKLAWGHRLEIYDGAGRHMGRVKEKIITFLPCFEIYLGERYAGEIRKDFTFFKPAYTLDCNGWHVQGDWLAWNYDVHDARGQLVMHASKDVFNWTDTYNIDVANPGDALISLMIVLAIDAAQCSRSD